MKDASFVTSEIRLDNWHWNSLNTNLIGPSHDDTAGERDCGGLHQLPCCRPWRRDVRTEIVPHGSPAPIPLRERVYDIVDEGVEDVRRCARNFLEPEPLLPGAVNRKDEVTLLVMPVDAGRPNAHGSVRLAIGTNHLLESQPALVDIDEARARCVDHTKRVREAPEIAPPLDVDRSESLEGGR